MTRCTKCGIYVRGTAKAHCWQHRHCRGCHYLGMNPVNPKPIVQPEIRISTIRKRNRVKRFGV